MAERKMFLIKDAWRDGSGNYSLAADPLMEGVDGLTAPWLFDINGSVQLVIQASGVIKGNLLIEANDEADNTWVTVLDINLEGLRFTRWQVPAYFQWRASISGFVGMGGAPTPKIDVWLES